MSVTPTSLPQPIPGREFNFVKTIPFFCVHLICLGAFYTGVNTVAILLCGLWYFVRMFGITAGYHRYFSHRAYKTSRFFQFVLAWLGCSALQKGPLWWASHHRHHHKHSDTEEDVHSPVTNSLWWSHLGWVIDKQYEETVWENVKDLSKYPELRWLNENYWLPGILLGFVTWLIGGTCSLIWASGAEAFTFWNFTCAGFVTLIPGFFLSTIILYHATFSINSIAHVIGWKRFATKDESRNNFVLALVTLGEGWHNNHHYYQSSANQGFYWWEVDISYSVLWVMEKVGLVWDLRRPPQKILNQAGLSQLTIPVEAVDSVETAAQSPVS